MYGLVQDRRNKEKLSEIELKYKTKGIVGKCLENSMVLF